MVHTKDKLLEAQEQQNKEYVVKIKGEHQDELEIYKGRISGLYM